MLIDSRYAQKRKDRRDDEDVVHRKALLDDVAGEIFQSGISSAYRPHPRTERHGDGDIKAIENKALLGADLFLLLMQEAEIKDHDRNDDHDESNPEPGRGIQERGR